MGEELKIEKCISSVNWEWFVTLTFDCNRVDSTNYNDVINKLSNFFNNLKKRVPSMKYFFVPELHADGERYHFHGLIADGGNLDIVNSIADWSWGFTSVTKIDNSDIALLYMSRKRRVFNYLNGGKENGI